MAKHRNILPLHRASQVRSGAVVKVAFETPNLFYFHFMLENEEIEWKQSSLQITLIFSYSLVWQNLKYFERRLSGCTKVMFALLIGIAQCSFPLNIATMTFFEYFGYVWKIREKVEFFIFEKSLISNLVFRGQTSGLQYSNHSQRLFSIKWSLVIWQIFCLILGIFTIINQIWEKISKSCS